MIFNSVRNFAPGLCLLLSAVASSVAQAQHLAPVQSATKAIANDPKPKPIVRVTISKETTYITEPLREDGYPDYLRYLNEKMSVGVTPENNAIVPLAKALGFPELTGETRKEYFKLLGIEPLPEKGDYFVPWPEYAANIPEEEQPSVPAGDKRTHKEYFDQLVEIGASRPWKREEFPHLTKWLDSNEKFLDVFVAASNYDQFYAPSVNDSDEPPTFGAVVVVSPTRIAGQALLVRAMRHAGEQNVRAATDDLMACHRLARLIATPKELIHVFLGAELEECTIEAEGALLIKRLLSRKEVLSLRTQRNKLPPMPRIAEALDFGERLTVSDATCWAARHGWFGIQRLMRMLTELGEEDTSAGMKKALGDKFITWLIDFDLLLKKGNEWLDKYVRVARIGDPVARAAALTRLQDEAIQVRTSLKTPPTRLQMTLWPRRTFSNLTGNGLVMLFCFDYGAVIQRQNRIDTLNSLLEIVIALVEHRVSTGQYPSKLEELVPTYLERVPVDAFAGRNFAYQKTANAFVLYSLGVNGKDDGGNTYENEEDADDVSIGVQASTQ